MNLFGNFASGILNQYVLSGTLNKPAVMAFGLTTVIPTNTTITEVANAAAYARQTYGPNTVGSTVWDYPNQFPNSGIAYNRSPIFFPVCTAAIGMVSGAFIADSASYGAGNVMYYTTLATPKDLQINDQFYIPASGASIRFS